MNSEKNKNDILDEITSLSNSDISNFMISTTKFGDLISNINTSSGKKSDLSHIRNRTSFNFDFSKGTMKTTLFTEDPINEEEENNNIDLNKRRTKSELNSNFFNQIFDNEEKEKSNDNLFENNDNQNNNFLLHKSLIPEIKNVRTINLGNSDEMIKNIKNEEKDFSIIVDNNNLFSLSDNINFQINEFEKENNNLVLNYFNNEINVKFKTNNIIDLVEKNQRKFYNGKLGKNLQEKIKEINILSEEEKKEKENIFTYDIIQISKIENLTSFSNEEKEIISSMTIDLENNIYCGTSKGKIIIYNLNDEKIKECLNNPFEKLYLNCSNSIFSISVYQEYFVCGYSNGYITLYFRKGNKFKLLKEIKNLTSEKIIDIKFYSIKDKVIIYSSDSKGNVYKTKIKYGWIKDSISNFILISNQLNEDNEINNNLNNNNDNDVKYYNSYYLIDIYPKNYNIIGFANKNGIFIYENEKEKKIEKIFEFIYPKEYYYLPYFFFGKDMNENKIFLSIDNLIHIYSIDNSKKINLESTFNFNIPIGKIGQFINNLIYIFDKNQNITLVNYTEKKTLNLNFDSGNNSINILNKEKNLYINKIIYNEKKKNYYPTFNNSLCSSNNGTILINEIKKIEFIEIINPKDCIIKIITDPNHLKWKALFNLIIQIYYDKHPLWKLNQIKNFKKLFTDISFQFLKLLLPNLCILEGENKDIVKKEIEFFIKFLFQIELIEFIIIDNDSKGMFSLFSEYNLNKYFFELLEPYIINDKLKIDGIPNSFFLNMINEYVKENKKEWLCQLLIHFPVNLIEKNNESIYNQIIENHLFNVIIFLINNKLKDIENVEEKKESEKNNIQDNNDNNVIDLFEPINLMKRYIFQNKEEKENEDLKKSDIDLYDDKIVYSNDYIRLKILWYINDIIENKFDSNNEGNYRNFINLTIKFLNSKEGFYLFNFSFSKEYFYTIEKILLNKKIDDIIIIRKDNIIDELYNIIKEKEKGEFDFFIFIINVLCNSNIDVKNKLKFQTILFFMNNNNEEKDFNYNDKFEDKLINVLRSIDSITLDENNILIDSSKKCENKYNKLFKYIKDNFDRE